MNKELLMTNIKPSIIEQKETKFLELCIDTQDNQHCHYFISSNISNIKVKSQYYLGLDNTPGCYGWTLFIDSTEIYLGTCDTEKYKDSIKEAKELVNRIKDVIGMPYVS